MYDFLLVCHCNYSSILYNLRVIWRWIISWPNRSWRSLKVIEVGAIWKHGYGFLFAFYSNYGDILYCLRVIATYWKSRIFSIPPVFSAPAGGDSVGISWRCLMLVKLEWFGYRMLKNLWRHVKPFLSDNGTFRTDRRTDLLYQYRASVCWRAIKTNTLKKHNRKNQATLVDPARKWSGLLYTGPGTTRARSGRRYRAWWTYGQGISSVLTLYGYVITVQRLTIIQQYGDWYTGRWWMDC